jgi:integrase
MSKSRFPRLRQKGKSFYFDTQAVPRVWIALGSDRAVAIARYKRLFAAGGAVGTVDRMIGDYIHYLTAGGRGMKGARVVKATIDQYRAWARHVGQIFGHMDPTEVTQGDIALYLHRCERTSARGEISLLSSAYQHAMIKNGITFNPCIGVRTNKPRARRDRYITDAELAAVREKSSPLLQVAIDLAYLTGLRVSDLLALRWDQFSSSGIVENRKTGVRQHFVLTDDLRDVLQAARALQGRLGSVYVLAGRGGQPLNRQTLGVWWRKACAIAGVKDAVWHDLRAKAGTDADAAGSDAQKLLGHTSAQTTRTYLRGKRILTVTPMQLKRVK